MSTSRSFHLHGHDIVVETATDAWADAVVEIIGAYADDGGAAGQSIRARLGAGDGQAPPGVSLVERCRFQDLVFLAGADGALWIDVHGKGYVRVDVARGEIEARLALDPVEDGWMVAHHAFYPALLEILKHRGMFPVHAGLVSRNGQGLLICGASGSGKTTLSLALAQQGWHLLADDTCFLRRSGDAVEALAFWEDLHVTEDTIARFPQLEFLQGQTPRRENWKKHFGINDLEGLQLAETTRPRWLVFPSVSGEPATRFQSVPGLQGALRLTPQSVVPAQPDLVAEHLGAITALAAQVEAFEVQMGTALAEVTERLHGFLGNPH